MKVTNIEGTSGKDCKCCGTWLKHWSNGSGLTLPIHCSVENCSNKCEVGAHVQKVDPTDRSTYIVPLCKRHNSETEKSLEVGSTRLVSDKESDNCETE